ncbi:MAG: S16 family serine protease, partial [Desulfobacterales bacterium]|nr:S16 family serine protease [Desulfobacterales bacterium]
IPEKNKRDLSEIPANVKRKIRFVRVKNMDEVLAISLEEAVEGEKLRLRKRKKQDASDGLTEENANPESGAQKS